MIEVTLEQIGGWGPNPLHTLPPPPSALSIHGSTSENSPHIASAAENRPCESGRAQLKPVLRGLLYC